MFKINNFLAGLTFTCLWLQCPSAIVFSQTIRTSYCDSTKQSLDLLSGTQLQGYIIYAWGERFTLASDNTFVDSVDFVVDSVASDSIYVILFSDTLIQTPSGLVRLPNIFANTAKSIYQKQFSTDSIFPHVRVKLPIPHVTVPHEFFMLLQSKVDTKVHPDQFRGESELEATFTANNTRAVGIGIGSGNRNFTFPINGNFVNDSGQKISTDFDFGITTESSDGVKIHLGKETLSGLITSPNPVLTGSLVMLDHVDLAEITYTIYDLCGRKLMEDNSWQEVNNHKISIFISGISPGVYSLILRGKSGEIQSSKIMITR